MLTKPSFTNRCCTKDICLNDGHLGGTNIGGDNTTWYSSMWWYLVDLFQAESVLDMGCGLGFSTKFFHDCGTNVTGIEGYQKIVDLSEIPSKIICHDYVTGPIPVNSTYDLVYSSEFVEHVEERFISNILHSFSLCKKVICLGAALPNTGGYHHVNCQTNDYWIQRVEPLGFTYSDKLTEICRNLTKPGLEGRLSMGNKVSISNFYNNGMLFIENDYLNNNPDIISKINENIS